MGLEKFNPFKRDSPNFPDVVIPLADGPAHFLSEKTDKETSPSLDGASSSENGAAGPKGSTSTPLTLEALRAEIEADVSTSTHDSAYDRTFLLDFLTGPCVEASCNWIL